MTTTHVFGDPSKFAIEVREYGQSVDGPHGIPVLWVQGHVTNAPETSPADLRALLYGMIANAASAFDDFAKELAAMTPRDAMNLVDRDYRLSSKPTRVVDLETHRIRKYSNHYVGTFYEGLYECRTICMYIGKGRYRLVGVVGERDTLRCDHPILSELAVCELSRFELMSVFVQFSHWLLDELIKQQEHLRHRES
jgi:hypothetical protein